MCLIVFAWQVIPGMPLIAASNRDEYYDRPAAPADWWDNAPQVYAGRDLQDKGTWQGITRDGKFAAITNVRAPGEKRDDAPSRGDLVANYLTGDYSPQEYVDQLSTGPDRYNGYNLLVGDYQHLIWYSNRGQQDARNGKPLAPGIYGLSNGVLDASWPKVVKTKANFASLLCQGAPLDAYFEMLTDTSRAASDCRLPKTGIDIELERQLSAVCIELPNYGTRVSTITQLFKPDLAVLTERLVR
jgi:uncharacterized protein with NRDE domain